MISAIITISIIFVVFIYIYLSSVNSDAGKKRQMEKRIRLEEEKERNRGILIAEKLEKNKEYLKEIAKVVVTSKDKLLKDYILKLDFRKLSYDYHSKDLTIEEQKTYYEEQIDQLRVLYKETSKYTSILPFMVQRIYNWYRFTHQYSEALFDAVKEFGFDMLTNTRALYDEALKFESEVSKSIKNSEKAYKKICQTTETRKKIIKEIKRISKDVVVFNNVEITIEEDLKVMDHIVCTNNGVFCLHTKYLSDDSIENLYISEENRWTGETFTGQKYHIEPVEGQVLQKIQQFQKWLNSELKSALGESVPYFMVYAIVIVANEYVHVLNESDDPIIKTEDIFNHIKLFKGQKIEDYYLEDMKSILNTHCKEHKVDTIDDNTEQLKKNSEVIENIFKTIDVINDCCIDYCKSIESFGIIRAYRQYLAMEHFIKYKGSVKDAKKTRAGSSEENYVNFLQDPEKPLIDRLTIPCITVPLKILSHALDLTIIKTEEMIQHIYDVTDIKATPAVSYQYINRAMAEIISMNTSKETLDIYMNTEVLNGIKLHKFKYFEINL